MRRGRPDLPVRLEALDRATTLLEQLDPATMPGTGPVQRARAVLDRTGQRQHLSGAHTVVAFAGATGSGKSSLVNAVSGTEAATVGARRPTTATAVGLYSGDAGGADLLDWLDVPQRHTADLPHGLVLVDLPDVDSVHTEHHRIAERLIDAVDVLVWVLDPQKYADAVVHTRYLRPMARHAQVTAVVLNQADLLEPADLDAVLADLHHRLAQDRIAPAHVLATSATTGVGVPELRQIVTRFASTRSAAHARMEAEVTRAAEDLTAAYPPPPEASLDASDVRAVQAAMAEAAGVHQVGAAVAASFRHRSRLRTGWPLTRWVRRMRPDPLQRLRLPEAEPAQDPDDGPGPVTTVTSRPGPAPMTMARVQAAVGRLGRSIAQGADEPWHSHLRTAADAPVDVLADSLDSTVVRGTPRPRPARWWPVIGLLHWVLLALLAAGALWLTVLAVAGYLQFPTPDPPQLGPIPLGDGPARLPAIPWPTALFLTGLFGGLLLAGIARLATRVGARRRAARTVRDLTRAVAAQVEDSVLEPVRHATKVATEYREALDQAGPDPRRRGGTRA